MLRLDFQLHFTWVNLSTFVCPNNHDHHELLHSPSDLLSLQNVTESTKEEFRFYVTWFPTSRSVHLTSVQKYNLCRSRIYSLFKGKVTLLTCKRKTQTVNIYQPPVLLHTKLVITSTTHSYSLWVGTVILVKQGW